ncbi:tyrosine-type recombinase/integrase [Pleomorphomonas carboxyditropha]|nr:tyrosine-type recombinase/integrase [Pleomorphomonas carboxyditropha]
MTLKLKHIDRFKDRHGITRFYFRPPGGKRIPLPDESDPGFLAAYEAAQASTAPVEKKAKVRGAEGTFDRLAYDYYRSTDFLGLKPSTQAKNRGLIDRFCEEHGKRLVRQMTRQNVSTIIGKKASTPAGANNLLKILNMLLRFGIANGYRTDNPAAGVKKFKQGTYHTWTEDEIEQFEAKWPIGTPERFAFALHLYTGQRRSDVCKMTWAAYDAARNTIDVAQDKTEAKLTISVHKDLRAVLDVTPRRHMVMLPTMSGKARSVAGYGNWLADAIGAAKLPDRCVLHGVRKAAARRLAEAGCSANEIMSITGHKTLSEVERYTKEAGQKALSKAAIVRLEEHSKDR